MDGKNATNPALQLTWQATAPPTDRQPAPPAPRITVIGIGNTGNAALTHFANMHIHHHTSTIAVNTDAHQLAQTQADEKILLPPTLQTTTQHSTWSQLEASLSNPEIILVAAELDCPTALNLTQHIAQIARKKGALTIGIAAKPLQAKPLQQHHVPRMLRALQQTCNTLVVINDSQLQDLPPNLPENNLVEITSQVLANVMKSILDPIFLPALKRLNVTDLKTVATQGSYATVSISESNSPNRAEDAARKAIEHPSMNHPDATGALVHVTGDQQLTLTEATQISNLVAEKMHHKTPVIWGATVDPTLNGRIKVTLIMTGVHTHPQTPTLQTLAPQLYNLEPDSNYETPVPIDLDLYQLENPEHLRSPHRTFNA